MNLFYKSKFFNIVLFTLILLWCIGIIWEVVIHFFPNTIIALPFLKYNYSLVCHREPDKLLKIGHYTTLVCSRCSGIYFGALISSFILLFAKLKKVSTKVMLLSSVPMFIDVILHTLGVYTYSKPIALFTGLLLGSVGFIYIHDALKIILVKQIKE